MAFSVQGHCDDEAGSAVSEEILSWNDRQGFSPCVIRDFYLSFQHLQLGKEFCFQGWPISAASLLSILETQLLVFTNVL